MTREHVLAHIANNLADVAADCGVPVEDTPKALKFVVDETLAWAGGNEAMMAGLANYFAYRLFTAKLITAGETPTTKFLGVVRGTEQWCANAGFNFGGGDT